MRDASRRPVAAAIGLAIVLLAVGASRPAPSSAHDGIGLERFMYALGQVESGGSYTAYNASSGAYGRYQIIPSSWRMWAKEVLGDAYAPMTPENQDKVAAYKLHQSYHRIGAWPYVAYWWLTGRYNTDRSSWTSYARGYVDKVMRIYNSDTTGAVYLTPPEPLRNVWYQENYRYIKWGQPWTFAAYANYQGGQAALADSAFAWVDFNFQGRAVTWIGPRGPMMGVAKVYVDGRYVRTIDLYQGSFSPSAEIFTWKWREPGTHLLAIRIFPTDSRSTVGVDSFRVTK